MMGLINSPDIFQLKMSALTDGLKFVHAYLDDLSQTCRNSVESVSAIVTTTLRNS